MKRLFLSLGFLFFAACASAPPQAWVQDTLYFGLSKIDGKVSEAQWQAFVDEEVTPRFPDGLTQWQAKGQWRESGKPLLKEDSRVLQILHPGSAEADGKIQAIRTIYKQRFGQSSVLRVKGGVAVEF